MSTLKIHLVKTGQLIRVIHIPAETAMEMTLTIAPSWVGLPKLISIVNIIEKINNEGYELASEKEADKIAELLTHSYIPLPMETWGDQTLQLEAIAISVRQVGFYEEVGFIRNKVRETVRDVISYDANLDPARVNMAQDQAASYIQSRVKDKPASWKSTILTLLLKAGITVLVDSFIGVPLSIIVTSVAGAFFGPHLSH